VGDYSLELARAADAARLADMSRSLIEAGLRPSWTASRIGWHIRNPDSVVLTAKAGTVSFGALLVVGLAIMRYRKDLAHLNLLAVEPVHRRRGVARQLIRWLEETAETAGTFVVGLELRASNESALQFYKKLGYRELDRVSGYYQGVEPAIRMSRDVRVAAHPAPASPR